MSVHVERNGRPSTTATLAALARASAHLERGDLRGPDHMARGFLPPPIALLLRQPLRWLTIAAYARIMPGAYAYVMARTRCFDDLVRAELAAGATQLVVLGAGYDTRAYRLRAELARATVFEVDAPSMSALKQRKVRELLGGPPERVHYVPVDLESENPADPLLTAGYDPGQRTAFLCEAVTFYLSPPAVDRMFAFVVERAGANSAIAFDYVFRDVVDGEGTGFGAKECAAFVKRKGEPFRFGLEPTDVAGLLSRHRLHMESNRLPEDLQREYLRGHERKSAVYRVGGYYGIATARVLGSA